MRVRKAVFPAAGLGTRFLPATKAQPKEMLPLVDKPIIQYGVEEALASGCDQIIIITGRGKSAIEDHFDVSYELEKMLQERGKTDLLAHRAAHLRHDLRVLCSPERGVRTGPRRSDGARTGRKRTFRRVARRRRHRRRNSLPEADDAGLRGDAMLGNRHPGGRRQSDLRLWRAGCNTRRRQVRRPLVRDHEHGGEAETRRRAVEPRHHRTVHLDSNCFRNALHRLQPARVASCSSPTG